MLFNGLANYLSPVGLLTLGPASALSHFLTHRCSQCQSRERPCVCECGGNSRPYMCGRCQPHNTRHVLLEIFGEALNMHTYIHPLNLPASFRLFYPFVLFITGLYERTDAPYFTGCNYPSTPPLPAPHSAQIQKNSLHYCRLTKGHILQCGMVSVSTDAFCGLTNPLAVLCIPL